MRLRDGVVFGLSIIFLIYEIFNNILSSIAYS